MRRVMAGEELQRGDAAFLARREMPSHDGLFARFVGERAEAEARRIVAQVDRPAGQHLGEAGHVRLGVAGRRTDGVQFHAFAGEVLVQPAMAALAGRTVRSNRANVVQIHQHRRMAHDRQQHVGEAPGHMRADRLLNEGAGDRCALAATQRDGEMVGPEPHQPLAEWRRGDQRIGQFRGRILAEHRAAARLAWRRLVPRGLHATPQGRLRWRAAGRIAPGPDRAAERAARRQDRREAARWRGARDRSARERGRSAGPWCGD